MRRTILLAALLWLITVSVRAQQPADVVVVTEGCQAKVGDKVVGVLYAGNSLAVGAAQGDWLWVNFGVGGWIERKHVAPPAEAVRRFTAAVEKNSQSAEPYYLRGRAWQADEKWSQAVADFDRAIEISPNVGTYFMSRGYAKQRHGDLAGAIRDYDEAVRLDPTDIQSYRLRASAWIARGQYEQAIDDYNRAVRIAPQSPAITNDRAWLLATCPDPVYRNGFQAIQDATSACELSGWKAFNRLGTLAAAYAESGKFDDAIKWQQKCLELAPAPYKQAQQSRLQLYQAHKPYREFAGLWK